MSTADALIAMSDIILDSIDDLNNVEYHKKGRKYKLVNNSFQRVREEDKHLIVYPQDPEAKLAAILAYFILTNIAEGSLLTDFPDFCRAIVGVAHQLETNEWYEEENSSVVNLKNARYNPMGVENEALEFLGLVSDAHIDQGFDILVASKVNFIHTDHHIGLKLDSHYIRNAVSRYYGPDCVNNPDILTALKSFVHWGNTKGILYKLEVPELLISKQLQTKFEQFPEPSAELKRSVYDRFPSGTSKYSLIKKAVEVLSEYKYAELIPYPTDPAFDLDWLYRLCHDIQKNPIRYHLRSSPKNLHANAVNSNNLSQEFASKSKKLLGLVAIIIHTFDNYGDYLLQNSKIPKISDALLQEFEPYLQNLNEIKANIESYENKSWNANDIVLRLKKNRTSIFDVVEEMNFKYHQN